MRAAFARLSLALDRLCREGAILFTVLMVALIAVQVVARYLFSEPPGWTEEGARYAMVWAGLLGATCAFRRGHDPVMARLKAFEGQGPLPRAGFALRAAAVLLFLGPVWWYCVFGPNADPSRSFLARSSVRTAESLGLSMAWFTVALPLAITVIFIHLLAQATGEAPAAGEAAQDIL